MKTKTAVLLSSTLLLCFISIALAATWYLSPERSTVIVDYEVSLNDIPDETTRYATVHLTGQATLGGSPLPGATIYIFLNDFVTEIDTVVTDGDGNYSFDYVTSEAAGTTLNFKAGIFE